MLSGDWVIHRESGFCPCANAEEPDLRNFNYFVHKLIVLDEADAELVIRKQISDAGKSLGDPSGHVTHKLQLVRSLFAQPHVRCLLQ